MKFKTIVISDLHLGTPDAKPQKLLKFLEKNTCDTLILNGDIIDGRHLKFLGTRKPEYDIFFKKLKNLCKKNKTEIHYLIGNHERMKNFKIFPLGEMEHELMYFSHGKKYLILHGDLFEKGIEALNTYATIMFFINATITWIDRNLGTDYKISRFLKVIFQKMSGGYRKMEKTAYRYATQKKADGIIAGHTHRPEIKMIKTIRYFNPGDRTEHCSALAEDNKGDRKIVYAK